MKAFGTLLIAIFALANVAWASRTCPNKLDVVLVVEDTNVLPDTTAENQVKQFLNSLIDPFDISDTGAHVAMQLFNDQSTTVFGLNKYVQPSDAKAAILSAKFTHKAVDAAISSALNYTWSNILTVTNGERACYPVVVVLVSFSSIPDPNGPSGTLDTDITAAKQLQNSGALIVTIGVGPNRDADALTKIAGNPNNYFDFAKFSDLNDQAALGITNNRICNYVPDSDFFPCQMEVVQTDIVFVVDISDGLNATLSDAITGFMSTYLKPYLFDRNGGVQAALVTYSKDADVAVQFSSTRTSDDFVTQAKNALSKAPSGTERNIYYALNQILYHVLSSSSSNYRPKAAHTVFIFSAGCFTGPDPVPTAQTIRANGADIFSIALGPRPGFWKENLDIVGDDEHLFQVKSNADVVLTQILPGLAWRYSCLGSQYCTDPSCVSAATTPSVSTTSGGPLPPPLCSACKADVVFVIDSSSGISANDFTTYVTPFMASLSVALDISSDQTHLAVVHYADPSATDVDFYLNNNLGRSQIAQTIRSMPSKGGNAALFTALDTVYNRVYTVPNGGRLSEYGTTTAAYIVLLTSGLVTDGSVGNPTDIAYEILNDGISIFAIGVGSMITDDFLYGLTYNRSRQYAIPDASHLSQNLVDKIALDTCCPINSDKPSSRGPPKYCDKLDIVFVLDEADSVNQANPSNFDALKSVMVDLVDMFTISQQYTRVAAIGYGTSASIHFHLWEPTDRNDLQSRIGNMVYMGGSRNVYEGLEAGYQEITNASRQATGTPVYLIHVVDYAHDTGDDPTKAAQQLGAIKVAIIAATVPTTTPYSTFLAETVKIIDAGGPGSTQFNSDTYPGLINSGLREYFQNILDTQFLCNA